MNKPTMYDHTPGKWIYEREDKVLRSVSDV